MKKSLACSAVILLCLTVGCTSNPAQPSGTSASPGSVAGTNTLAPLSASIVAPRPVAPLNNATIRNADQPVTLVVQNAVITKPSGSTYTFDLASDSAFTTNEQTTSGVAEGPNGQTSVSLALLAAGRDYYWRARATSGGTTGVFGPIYKFTIGPAVIVNAPVPIGPLTGAQTFARPALRVTNATRQGPAGPITYKFDVAIDPAFSSIVMTGTNTEGVNETGFIPTADLPSTGTLYWRATAIDASNGVASPPSAVQSFTANQLSQAGLIAAKLGVPLWPGVQPPGTIGNATLGGDWNVEPLVSFNGVTFLNPPIDEVRIFDLLDRGFDPQSAIDWMNSHGYSTSAAWYPGPAVIGFQYEYLAFNGNSWDIVVKVGA